MKLKIALELSDEKCRKSKILNQELLNGYKLIGRNSTHNNKEYISAPRKPNSQIFREKVFS